MSNVINLGRRWLQSWERRRAAGALKQANVGSHTYIDPSVQVLGWKNVRIGHHTVVSEDTFINVNDRTAAGPSILIGDNCFLGRRNFLSSGALIKVGDYCLTGIDCHFLGADHVYASPFVPCLTTGTTIGGIIEVGPNCWLGSSVTVLKGVKVGYGSILGAAAVITRDIPPLSVVVGNPGRVIRRFSREREAWIAVADYPEDGDAHLPSEAEYLEALRASHPAIKSPRIASSKRFGDL